MEKEAWKVYLVVQGMLMEFECRFLKRMVWCITFDIWLCLNVVHRATLKNMSVSGRPPG